MMKFNFFSVRTGRFLLLAGFAGVLSLQAQSQQVRPPNDLQAFQEAVKHSFSRSVDATVKLFVVNEATGHRRFTGSAVVVSPEGLILTVAHVNVPKRIFVGQFPNGKEIRIKGLGEIGSLDAAMMQIEDEGVYPYVPIGRSANLQHGQPNISLGYAGSLNLDRPALRLGFIVKSTTNTNRRMATRLQTTSLMEPGDSGGAVFDLQGNLIGLRSSINRSLDANFEIPIDHYHTYWDALLSGEEFARPPDSLARILTSLAVQPKHSYIQYSDTNATLLKVFKGLDVPVYGIHSRLGDSVSISQGTLVDVSDYLPNAVTRKKSFLLSKSSIVGESPEIHQGVRKAIKAKVVFRDPDRDLVLLEIPQQRGEKGFVLAAAPDSVSHELVGTFVHSPLSDGNLRVSVLGSTPFKILGQSRVGYFGAALESTEQGVVFSQVQDNSPAKKAALDVGMRLLRIDDEVVSSPQTFVEVVQKKLPGEKVKIEYMAGELPYSKEIVLTSRPLATGTHIAERFEGGKSIVRDGFSRVFAHDGRLHPSEIGSPLVDLQGNLYGINIARLSRTSTLALPVDEVKAFLSEAAAATNKAEAK